MLAESLRKFGKMKIRRTPDHLNSHKFKMGRGLNRKKLGQVPVSQQDGVKGPKLSTTIAGFVNQMDVSNKSVDIAKKAPSGVWRISKTQVLDIAKKYKFNIPNDDKPMKHLGSTGIQLVRFKPNIYYLYKPHCQVRKKRIKSAVGKTMGNFKMGMNG